MKLNTLKQRIRDRLSPQWLTPSQQAVWQRLQQIDGAPHHVVNVYGGPGSGKTFLGWLMEREGYATYGLWSARPHPIHPRLALDNAPTARQPTRDLRPQVEKLGVRQIILLSRQRVDELAMPALELVVTPDDLAWLRANLWRHLDITIPEGENIRDYSAAIDAYLRSETHGD